MLNNNMQYREEIEGDFARNFALLDSSREQSAERSEAESKQRAKKGLAGKNFPAIGQVFCAREIAWQGTIWAMSPAVPSVCARGYLDRR